ncbi:MAG TPA: ferritin-like domain-containing protein [Acidimicrobiales bacterium]|nr:ferritin-like domain-containing protein [Acidimicrobiales bacterium]
MRSRRSFHLPISQGELAALTRDLDELHHATLPAMRSAAAEWSEELRTTRRRFLAGGAAFGGLLLAGCGDARDEGEETRGEVLGARQPRPPTGDFAIAALAASIENLAVATYQMGIAAADAGRLGPVPPAVAGFARTAQRHHADHAGAWNEVLANGGRVTVDGIDETAESEVVDPALGQLTDVAGLARVALSLENVAAATYLRSIANLENTGARKVAASIQPVEMQHAAILSFLLGQYPVPDSFAKEDGARPLSDRIAQ